MAIPEHGLVVPNCNPCTQEAKAEDGEFGASLGYTGKPDLSATTTTPQKINPAKINS